jgi:26S proteasome regulatory subunit N11
MTDEINELNVQIKKINVLFNVYIKEGVLKRILEHCRTGGELEVFGYLVGEIFNWKNQLYIVIEDELFIKESGDSQKYTIKQLEGFSGKFQQMLKEIRRKKDNFLILGWWHSHPDYGCFLSKTDTTTTNYFFSEPYHVALVCDHIRNDFAFFKTTAQHESGYKEVSFAIIND